MPEVRLPLFSQRPTSCNRAATSEKCQKATCTRGALFNNGGRACNQNVGHLNSQLLGRLEIDNKFKPHGLRVRYVARIGPSEYFGDLRCHPVRDILEVGAIGHQSACFRKMSVRVNGGKPHVLDHLNQQGLLRNRQQRSYDLPLGVRQSIALASLASLQPPDNLVINAMENAGKVLVGKLESSKQPSGLGDACRPNNSTGSLKLPPHMPRCSRFASGAGKPS